jgi:4-amino-4-deoxy-L-arabinose transferase-like glycosyltransferase
MNRFQNVEQIPSGNSHHVNDRIIPFKVLLIIGLLAFVLRVVNIQDIHIQHMDESVYTTSAVYAMMLIDSGQDDVVMQIIDKNIFSNYFATPLYFILVTLFFKILAPGAVAAIMVSILAGVCCVIVLSKITAKYFGRQAGIICGLLLATSEYHLLYSRMALTDSLFTLFFVIAVYKYYCAFNEKTLSAILQAGVFTALSCWTKYTGAIVPVLAIMAFVAESFICGKKNEIKPVFFIWFKATAIALCLVLPIVWVIDANPGWEAWFEYRSHHTAYANLFESIKLSITEYGASVLLWIPVLVVIAAICCIYREFSQKKTKFMYFIFVVAFFLLSTIVYNKYPRLILPVIPLVIMLAAVGVKWVLFAVLAGKKYFSYCLVLILTVSCLYPLGRCLGNYENCYSEAVSVLADEGVQIAVSPDFSPILFISMFSEKIQVQLNRKPQNLPGNIVVVTDRDWRPPKEYDGTFRVIKTAQGYYNEVEASNRIGALSLLLDRKKFPSKCEIILLEK